MIAGHQQLEGLHGKFLHAIAAPRGSPIEVGIPGSLGAPQPRFFVNDVDAVDPIVVELPIQSEPNDLEQRFRSDATRPAGKGSHGTGCRC